MLISARRLLAMKHWDPSSFLLANKDTSQTSTASSKTALIIINTPIIRKDVFSVIWENASLRYCADGGANRIYDAFAKKYTPDLIKGDLDSLRADVKDYYESKGVPIVKDDDQYSTDLGKCIASLVEEEERSGTPYQLVVYGGLSGRLDQTAHTLHALYKLRSARAYAWIVSEESLTCVLDKGKHTLKMPASSLGPTCGILPLGVDSAKVTTTGLEWDLHDDETSFDGLLSTSNHLKSDSITVETDKPVIWTAELRPEKS